MTRRATFLYGALGGLAAAAGIMAFAFVTGVLGEVLDHLIGTR